MKSKNLLLLALGFAYTGEYNSLISLLEHSRHYGSAKYPIVLYVVYSLPSILLLALSAIWKEGFTRASRYLPLVYFAGALALFSCRNASVLPVLIFSIFLLALFRQWTKVLTLTFIQAHTTDLDRGNVVSHMVSLRFVVMILGATIGGYLGGRGDYSLSLAFQAATYLIAGLIFARVSKNNPSSVIPASHVRVENMLLTFKKDLLAGFKNLRGSLGLTFLVVVAVAYIAVGSFMSVEYPLLTTDLGVLPSALFITYMGHIFGALLSRRATPWAERHSGSVPRALELSAALACSYAFVGFGPKFLGWYSFQLGICAFILPLFEVFYSATLMKKSSVQAYPTQALALNMLIETTNLSGSAIPLYFVGRMTSLASNRITEMGLLGVMVFIALVRKPYSSKKIIGIELIEIIKETN